MQLKLAAVTVKVDALDIEIDPQDLGDEALMQCMSLATERGLLDGQAAELRLAIERAYASLVRGNPNVAMAQLALVIDPATALRHIKGAIYQQRGGDLALNGEANGQIAALGRQR